MPEGMPEGLRLPALPQAYRPVDTLSRRENRVVLRAFRQSRSVVLKCLCPPVGPEDLEDFRREYLLLDALAHPYWVRPRRFFELPGGGFAIELDEAPGVPLERFSLRGWWPEVLEIARRILSGLQALHNLGFAQLDLNPGQVLVRWGAAGSRGWGEESLKTDTELDVRLLDLGLASSFGTPLRARGTPGYMAPELVRGEPWDRRADLYAVGAILFELLTGERPFSTTSVRELLDAQLAGRVREESASALPPAVRVLLAELLSPDPGARPADAVDVWERLREQAPRQKAGAYPTQLTGPAGFSFFGREAEIEAFTRWCGVLEGIGPFGEASCRIVGEEGIGRRRLARRLAALAQTMGWDLAESDEASSPGGERQPAAWPIRVFRQRDRACILLEPAGPGEEKTKPGSGGRIDGRGPCLRLPLGPMPVAHLERLLAGQAFESAAMRQALAVASLGSPGLLQAFCEGLPRELDLAARYGREPVIDHYLVEAPIPASWLGWARGAIEDAGEAGADFLLLLALATEISPRALDALLPERVPEGCLAPLLARGVVASEGTAVRLVSPLWARAFTGAQPERTARLGRSLLSGGFLADPGNAVAAARLALRVGEWAIVRRRLRPALEDLHGQGRFEEEIGLFSQVCDAAAPKQAPVDGTDFLRLAGTLFAIGTRGGGLLPSRLAAVVEEAGSPASGRLLLAWSALGRGDVAGALGRIADVPEDGEVGYWAAWFRFWACRRGGNLEAAHQALERVRVASVAGDASSRVWIAAGEARLALDEARYDAAAAWMERVREDLGVLSPGDQASLLQTSASIHDRRGEYGALLADSLEAEALWRAWGFTTNHLYSLGSLSATFYREGNLSKAQLWNEDQIREWARRARWHECLTAALNLGLILLNRGHLGQALAAGRDAHRFAQKVWTDRNRLRLGAHQCRLYARIGLLGRCQEKAADLLGGILAADPSYEPRIRGHLGEALASSGEPGGARGEFRRAADQLLQAGSPGEAVELFAIWGLHECEAGERARAADLRAELAPHLAKAPPLIAVLAQLLEGELALPGPGAAEALRAAAATLEAQDYRYFAWRARWRLAQAELAAGRQREAAGEYAAARSILTSLLESFPSAGMEERFLGLPAPRAFIREIADG